MSQGTIFMQHVIGRAGTLSHTAQLSHCSDGNKNCSATYVYAAHRHTHAANVRIDVGSKRVRFVQLLGGGGYEGGNNTCACSCSAAPFQATVLTLDKDDMCASSKA